MTPDQINAGGTALGSEAMEEMAKHGITCRPLTQFIYGEYRYTSLADAVAEAERHPHHG